MSHYYCIHIKRKIVSIVYKLQVQYINTHTNLAYNNTLKTKQAQKLAYCELLSKVQIYWIKLILDKSPWNQKFHFDQKFKLKRKLSVHYN